MNLADADFASVVGGEMNSAVGVHSSVSGGYSNVASGLNTPCGPAAARARARVRPRRRIVASGRRCYAACLLAVIFVVCLGFGFLFCPGPRAFVGGGSNNTASGYLSFVSGGFASTAEGAKSAAVGHLAHAEHLRSMVFGFSDHACRSTGNGALSLSESYRFCEYRLRTCADDGTRWRPN